MPQIKVRTLTGKEIEIDVEEIDRIIDIKQKVEAKEGIPPVQQRLIFSGKQVNDEKPISEYGIEAGATLHLVLALRGGKHGGAEEATIPSARGSSW